MTLRATHPEPIRRLVIGALIGAALVVPLIGAATPSQADTWPEPSDWASVLEEATGQTVYFHAWGGDTRINDYIRWAGDQVEARYGVTVEHVKVSDTANVVSQVLAEKTAGKTEGGSVDLVWINGENFANMKANGLLAEASWADQLPSWRYVDVDNKPTVVTDFTVPTDGLEAPWGMAQLVFMYDTDITTEPPLSAEALLKWAQANPGRVTYPSPPDFVGSTFLKQILTETAGDPSVLQQEATNESFAAIEAGLFGYLEALHPHLWRSGETFPQNYPNMINLMADGEIDLAFAFNPAAASNAIAAGDLPETVRTYVFEAGTIGNTHFVAIPFNANAGAGALVFADFLMSGEAQARKQDPTVWGDPTVLDVAALPEEDRAAFAKLERGIATLAPEDLSPTLPEPHPSWMVRIEEAWLSRFGVR